MADDFRSVLASVDTHGKRLWQYVQILPGFWRRRRRLVAWLITLLYLASPFIHLGHQRLIQIDIPARQYILLGQVFWPQDAYYLLLGILLFVVASLLLISLFGRVFCGWLCPHNLSLEFFFRPIEQLLEGPAHRRQRQDQQALRGGLWLRKGLKYALYVLISWAFANTLTAWFLSTEHYLHDFIGHILVDPRLHPSAFTFWAITFGILLFNFAWFREQTCTIVCPYGRFQAVMLDRDTLSVSYDPARGEPRGKGRRVANDGKGDCVDCGLCQQVCPTGIDIRNGNQLECLHCAACIDACDQVMARIKRPAGLIRYSSEHALAGGRFRYLRPRALWYGLLLGLLGTITVLAVLGRDPVHVVRQREKTFAQLTTNGHGESVVRKHFVLALINKTGRDIPLRLALDPAIPGRLISQYADFTLPASKRQEAAVFIEIPAERFDGAQIIAPVQVIYDGTAQTTLPLRLRHP